MKVPIQDIQTLRPRDNPDIWSGPFHPYPQEPDSAHRVPDSRTISDSWLTTKSNDGHGTRSSNVQTFFWRTGNAFNLKALLELKGHAQRLDQTSYLVCSIIRAAEDYDFCPGADLLTLLNSDIEQRKVFYRTTQEVCYALATMRTPGFICMQGNTMGLGAGLASSPPFRVAMENTAWALPQVMYGAVPDCGLSFKLSRLPGEMGIFLALTGKRVVATDVLRAGLATHYMSMESLQRFEQETTRIETNELEDLFVFLNNHIKTDLDRIQVSALNPHIEAIDRCFSKRTLEEIFEALEKENTEWSKKILDRMTNECSPLMLQVTFRLFRMGRYLNTLEEALEMEYRVMQHVINSDDYTEGITSRINLKRRPRWKHATIYDVTTNEVAAFFEPTGEELNLQATHQGQRPDKNPYRVYIDQMQAYLDEPMAEPLMQYELSKLLPANCTLKDVKAFYTEIMKEGGLDYEAGRYWTKHIETDRHDTSPFTIEDMESQMLPSSEEVPEGEEEEAIKPPEMTADEEEKFLRREMAMHEKERG